MIKEIIVAPLVVPAKAIHRFLKFMYEMATEPI